VPVTLKTRLGWDVGTINAPGDRVATEQLGAKLLTIHCRARCVDRMEVFADERSVEREPANSHVVLDHVRKLAANRFASHIRLVQDYDLSLPPVLANRDQLVQVFLNLVKNAAEAIDEGAADGEIQLTTRSAQACGCRCRERLSAAQVLRQGQWAGDARRPDATFVRPVRHD
jgi:Dihydrouridine synthase (Dus)